MHVEIECWHYATHRSYDQSALLLGDQGSVPACGEQKERGEHAIEPAPPKLLHSLRKTRGKEFP